MDFQWDMTKENWENYMRDHSLKDGKSNFSEDADMYGCCRVGKIKFDFQHTLDSFDWYPFVNMFVFDIDEGYGDVDGRPYACIDHNINVPIKARTFKEFKKKFETNVLFNLRADMRKYARGYRTESLENWMGKGE